MHVLLATAVTAAVALATAEVVGALALAGRVPKAHARKALHVAMGPIFLLCWALFPVEGDGTTAGYLAASIPFLMTLKFIMVGLGLVQDPRMVATASRTGVASCRIRRVAGARPLLDAPASALHHHGRCHSRANGPMAVRA